MVQNPSARNFLRAAGDLQPFNGNITGARERRRNSHTVERFHDRADKPSVVGSRSLCAGYARIIDISTVMINRSAARFAPYNCDTAVQSRRNADLGKRILIAAADDCGVILPKIENIVLRRVQEQIFFKRLIKAGII